MKNFFNLPINIRLFIINFILIVFTAITTGLITFYFFSDRTKEFYTQVIEKKEENIARALNLKILNSEEQSTKSDLYTILKDKILESSAIQEVSINIYNLKGNLILSSVNDEDEGNRPIAELDKEIIDNLNNNQGRFLSSQKINDYAAFNSYRFLYNKKHEPIGILNIPYLYDTSVIKSEYNQLFRDLAIGILIAIVIALALAWFSTIEYRKRLSKIIANMEKSNILQIEDDYTYNANDELGKLLKSHSSMLKKFQTQSENLINLEREMAWKDIAKQVAHEIKNPLTPMRLLIQSFQRHFNPNAEHANQKIKEFTDSLIVQIDIINKITTAFSDYTNLPERKDVQLDVVKEIENCLEIFDQDSIDFHYPEETILIHFDHTSLFRIVTNIIKNSFQAIPNDREPKIEVNIAKEAFQLKIAISDNGIGVDPAYADKIFVPQFSTKSTGSGLGLPMVKKIIEDYGGSIAFYNNATIGTTFVILLPINEQGNER